MSSETLRTTLSLLIDEESAGFMNLAKRSATKSPDLHTARNILCKCESSEVILDLLHRCLPEAQNNEIMYVCIWIQRGSEIQSVIQWSLETRGRNNISLLILKQGQCDHDQGLGVSGHQDISVPERFGNKDSWALRRLSKGLLHQHFFKVNVNDVMCVCTCQVIQKKRYIKGRSSPMFFGALIYSPVVPLVWDSSVCLWVEMNLPVWDQRVWALLMIADHDLLDKPQ